MAHSYSCSENRLVCRTGSARYESTTSSWGDGTVPSMVSLAPSPRHWQEEGAWAEEEERQSLRSSGLTERALLARSRPLEASNAQHASIYEAH